MKVQKSLEPMQRYINSFVWLEHRVHEVHFFIFKNNLGPVKRRLYKGVGLYFIE